MLVQSLGQEDPLEEGMAAHSSVLAWRIPWTEEPGGLQSRGLQRAGVCAHAQSYFTLLCRFLQYTAVNQLYVYIHPLFFGSPLHLGRHRAMSRVSCALQYLLISYLLYT